MAAVTGHIRVSNCTSLLIMWQSPEYVLGSRVTRVAEGVNRSHLYRARRSGCDGRPPVLGCAGIRGE